MVSIFWVSPNFILIAFISLVLFVFLDSAYKKLEDELKQERRENEKLEQEVKQHEEDFKQLEKVRRVPTMNHYDFDVFDLHLPPLTYFYYFALLIYCMYHCRYPRIWPSG